jgi:hypothetical protein
LQKMNAARKPGFSSSPISSRSILNLKYTNALRASNFEVPYQDVTFLGTVFIFYSGSFLARQCAAINR